MNDKWPGLASRFPPPAWGPFGAVSSERRSGEALKNHRAVTEKRLWVWGQESEGRLGLEG